MQKLVWQNANGVELDLTSGNYGITEWEGFSNASLNIQSQQVPFQDGGVFLDALIEQRELSVTLAIQDNNNLELRYQQRRELISALNPKLGEGYLIYTNDFISKRIKCIPQIPLFETHNSNDTGTPKASLSWTACEPYWEDLEETVVEISASSYEEVQNEGDVAVGFEIITTDGETEIVITNQQDKLIHIQSKNPLPALTINTKVGQKGVTGKGLFSAQGQEYTITSQFQNLWTLHSNIVKIEDYYYTMIQETTGDNIIMIKSSNILEWEQVGSILNKNDFGSSGNRQILNIENKIYILSSGSVLSITEDLGLTWTHQNTSYKSMCVNENTKEMYYSIKDTCAYNPTTNDIIEIWRDGNDEKIKIYRGDSTIEKTFENTYMNPDYTKVTINKIGQYIIYSTDPNTGRVIVVDINGNQIAYVTGGVGVFEWQERSDGYYGVYNVPFITSNSNVAYMSKDFQTVTLGIQSFPHHTSVAQVIDGLMYVFDSDVSVVYTTKLDSNNFISNLVMGSDLTMGLEVGDNRIAIMSEYGMTLKYRQKYIGV